MKLNSEHHEMLLNFAEKSPQIVTNRFTGLNANEQNKNLWQKLVNQLNALGYGNLMVSDYKRRLTDWKSKVKAKAAQIDAGLKGTGGGEGTNLTLTKHEQRLLALMGNKSYKGDDVHEMGFGKKEENVYKKRKCSSEENENCVPTTKIFVPQRPTFVTLQASSIQSQKPTLIQIHKMPKMLPNQNMEYIDSSFITQETNQPTRQPTKRSCLSFTMTSEGQLVSDDEDVYLKNQEESVNVTETQPLNSGKAHRETSEGSQKTPSSSTNRRRCLTNMSETVKNMNDETLIVLRNIDDNLSKMNKNLENISDTLKDISANVFPKENV